MKIESFRYTLRTDEYDYGVVMCSRAFGLPDISKKVYKEKFSGYWKWADGSGAVPDGIEYLAQAADAEAHRLEKTKSQSPDPECPHDDFEILDSDSLYSWTCAKCKAKVKGNILLNNWKARIEKEIAK